MDKDSIILELANIIRLQSQHRAHIDEIRVQLAELETTKESLLQKLMPATDASREVDVEVEFSESAQPDETADDDSISMPEHMPKHLTAAEKSVWLYMKRKGGRIPATSLMSMQTSTRNTLKSLVSRGVIVSDNDSYIWPAT